ncbi:MAG TPA: peptidoglycan editing factor PgeF [Bryobacteraceae bacterium]|nr:peptidoglycan editing factor PgeF [Bryobacteraceae bacterium]
MFRLEGQVYRSDALARLPWVDHAFGTRLNADPPANTATLRQIHSNTVIPADRPGDMGAGDALVSSAPGLALLIRTADCLPVLIADTRRRVVAAVHAGWRGTVRQIIPETIEKMAELYGSRGEDLVIAIGPAIGGCCYEVGAEVASQFSSLFPERADLNGTTKIDLAETAIRQLRRHVGTVGQIDPSGVCTRCSADLFHSYRRDGEAAGRMFSWIRIRE